LVLVTKRLIYQLEDLSHEKIQFFSLLVSLPVILFSLSAQAHDPKEHMQNAEKPDCGAIKNGVHSKMDTNDPVMIAMMEKCKGHMGDDTTDEHADYEKQAEKSSGMTEEKHDHTDMPENHAN